MKILVDSFEGNDDQKIASAIQKAKEMAVPGNQNKNVTVYFSERKYRLNKPIEVHGHLWLASEGQGRRSTRLIFNGVKSDDTLIKIRGGYGGGLRGLDIRTGPVNNVERVTAFELESVSSFTVEQVEADMLAAFSTGIETTRSNKNVESLVIRDSNIKAHTPIDLGTGDNISLQNLDLTCRGGMAPIKARACDNLVIFNISGQGGAHAGYFYSKDKNMSGLTIIGYRHEQPTHKDVAWVFDFKGVDGSDNLDFVDIHGCRHHAHYNYAFQVRGVRSFNHFGGFMPARISKVKPDANATNN